MKAKLGLFFMMLGAVLIFGAQLLYFYNMIEDDHAGQTVSRVLPEVQNAIAENMQNLDPIEEEIRYDHIVYEPAAVEKSLEMQTTVIDGNEYIGYLSIPTLELELPVMSDWNYDKLKAAPCRQFGSTKSNDIVISGHNYRRHFGKLNLLQIDDPVIFTDMEGNTNIYEVLSIETLQPTQVEEMRTGDWDLTMYTCNYAGDARITIRCGRITI